MGVMLRKLKQYAPARVLLWVFHAVRAFFVYPLNFRSRLEYLAHRNTFGLSPAEEAWLATLRREGIVMIDLLFDVSDIERINLQLDQLLSDQANRDITNVNAFNHENKLRLERPISKIPDLAGIAFNETICKIASAYKGFIPIHVLNVYKTVPGDALQGSSNFHRDDLGDMSVFVYLHDVDAHSGASCYVKRSHGYTLKSCFLLSNYEKGLRDPNQAYADSEVAEYYPRQDWVWCNARRGTVVMMDVTGIHKGPYWIVGDPLNTARNVVHMVFRQKNLFRSASVPDRAIDDGVEAGLGAVGRLVCRQCLEQTRAQ